MSYHQDPSSGKMKTLLKVAVLAGGCVIHGWYRGERETYTLVVWAIFGTIIAAASIYMDRYNETQICDDKHIRR